MIYRLIRHFPLISLYIFTLKLKKDLIIQITIFTLLIFNSIFLFLIYHRILYPILIIHANPIAIIKATPFRLHL